MWKTFAGRPIVDIGAEVHALMHEGRRTLHIGTDARQFGGHTDYVTAITVLYPGLGGRVFYKRERSARSRSMAEKLFREVELSVQAALALVQVSPSITIHVDANHDQRHGSSSYLQALSGMVTGYGFHVRVKPDAWCATHVADFVVKEKHERAA